MEGSVARIAHASELAEGRREGRVRLRSRGVELLVGGLISVVSVLVLSQHPHKFDACQGRRCRRLRSEIQHGPGAPSLVRRMMLLWSCSTMLLRYLRCRSFILVSLSLL